MEVKLQMVLSGVARVIYITSPAPESLIQALPKARVSLTAFLCCDLSPYVVHDGRSSTVTQMAY